MQENEPDLESWIAYEVIARTEELLAFLKQESNSNKVLVEILSQAIDAVDTHYFTEKNDGTA
tara:strand:+ start:2794 stop:2979 length:186 start_codon:yes stop_codon:yes gene_type:complete